jgi:long-subunit fatty acid transport protein
VNHVGVECSWGFNLEESVYGAVNFMVAAVEARHNKPDL